MTEILLTKIQAHLAKEGIDCAILHPEEEMPIPRLFVYLGVDHESRERTMEITVQEQILPKASHGRPSIEVESGFYRLQIQSLFPIRFEARYASNVASSINFINGMLELPGLFSDEVRDQVFYRTIQLLTKKDFDSTLLEGIVGMHRMVLDIFSDLLEKMATGTMTHFEFLEEIVKHTQPAK